MVIARCETLPRQSLARTSVRQCSHAKFTLCSTHLLLSHETAAAWVGGRRLQLFACTDGPVIPIYADPMIVYTVSGPTSKDILCLHALAFLFSICLHALAFLREAARASVLRRPRPWQRLSCGRDCPMEAGSAALHVRSPYNRTSVSDRFRPRGGYHSDQEAASPERPPHARVPGS